MSVGKSNLACTSFAHMSKWAHLWQLAECCKFSWPNHEFEWFMQLTTTSSVHSLQAQFVKDIHHFKRILSFMWHVVWTVRAIVSSAWMWTLQLNNKVVARHCKFVIKIFLFLFLCNLTRCAASPLTQSVAQYSWIGYLLLQLEISFLVDAAVVTWISFH